MKTAVVLLALALPAAPQVTVFENVQVIPMDRERVLERQNVVVRGGRIVEIGPAGHVTAPKDALRVNSAGKYLMPGFAEMHGHLPNPASTPRETIESLLFMYLANGVTTVRGMLGHPGHLELRAEVASGKLLGPTLYLAGPAFGGADLTPEEAVRRVREQKAAGFDLLKVQEGLRAETYDAMVKEARQAGIRFGGHVPNDVGLLRALEAGQSSIDHLDNYLEALEPENSPLRNADPKTRARQLALHADESRIPALAKATREAGAFVVPTMALWETFNSTESPAEMGKREELKFVPRQWVEQWSAQKAKLLANLDPENGRRVIALRKKILYGLRDADVPIIFGTDSPQTFSVPGFSIHREIPILREAGLTSYEILVSGTRNVARYFGADNEFGTVETGRRADLLLLDANPLKDATALKQIAGVMARGRWLPRTEIQARLANLKWGP